MDIDTVVPYFLNYFYITRLRCLSFPSVIYLPSEQTCVGVQVDNAEGGPSWTGIRLTSQDEQLESEG